MLFDAYALCHGLQSLVSKLFKVEFQIRIAFVLALSHFDFDILTHTLI